MLKITKSDIQLDTLKPQRILKQIKDQYLSSSILFLSEDTKKQPDDYRKDSDARNWIVDVEDV